MMKAKEIVVDNIEFDNPPFETYGYIKHYGTTEGKKIVFYLKKEDKLTAGSNGVKIYHKPDDPEKVDKAGYTKISSAKLEPWEYEDGDKKGGSSNSYNDAQQKRLEYEKTVRDPKLTVQGLMSNYSTIISAVLANGGTQEDADKVCDWVLNRAKTDAKDLTEYAKQLNDGE